MPKVGDVGGSELDAMRDNLPILELTSVRADDIRNERGGQRFNFEFFGEPELKQYLRDAGAGRAELRTVTWYFYVAKTRCFASVCRW